MSIWLLKTEPTAYSYADLERDKRTHWDGVTNPMAQRNMRAMALDDMCVIYHTGDERQAVGLARVVRAPYPDSGDPAGRRVLVDIQVTERLATPVGLPAIKASPLFAESPLVRQGRLSVVELSATQFDALGKMSG